MKKERSIADLKRKAREIVVKALYEFDMGGLSKEEAIRLVDRKCSHSPVRGFALRLVETAIGNVEPIDRVLEKVVANWSLSRMAAVDRNVLRVGATEILFFDDVPDKVAINEAIEIAKMLSTERSGKFVNGVLDRIARMKSDLRHLL